MVLSVIAATARRCAACPSPEDVETFEGRDIDAWVVSERTDAEIQDAVASVPRWPRCGSSRPSRTPRSTRPRGRGGGTAPPAALEAPPRRDARRQALPPPRSGRRPRPESRTARARRLLDGPRRRRAPRPAHALHGRARPAPHAGRGARLAGRRAGPLAGDAEPHAHVARPAVDGHAGPDDPGGGRLPALPAARARPLDQARQAGRPAARGQGHRARPHGGRRARRPARAPRAQLARPRPRGARGARRGGQAGDGHAGDLRPPRRRQRDHHGRRRRPRHRPRARRRQGRRARADHRRRPSTRSTWRAPSSCSSPRLLHGRGHERHLGRGVGMDAVRAAIRGLGGES